jgi:hypothetical protein
VLTKYGKYRYFIVLKKSDIVLLQIIGPARAIPKVPRLQYVLAVVVYSSLKNPFHLTHLVPEKIT